jgi:hypothetical protein
MAEAQHPGLEIGEDIRQQKVEWTVQRIVWPVLLLLLIGSIVGLFGRGPVSDATLGEPGASLQLKYQRFIRHRAPDQLQLTITPSGDTARVMLDSHYAAQVELQNVTPQPQEVIAAEDALIFVFSAGSSGPIEAVFHIQPETVGNIEGWVSLDDGPRQPFSQFVYP